MTNSDPEPDDPDPAADRDDTLVLPEHAVDDALDTVRTGADEFDSELYASGVADGAEQMHRLLTSLDLSDSDLG